MNTEENSESIGAEADVPDFFSGSDEDFLANSGALLESSDALMEQAEQPQAETAEEPEEAYEEEQAYEEEESHEEPEEESTEQEEEPEAEEDSQPEAESAADVPEEYKRIFEPFKANGKTIKVDTADDALSLMQMGANYHKKMQDLKPHLKTVKMLKSHDLLDEQKLSLIIDATKGDPAAFRELAKAANVDLGELTSSSYDDESTQKYEPKNYQISDEQFELDSTLDDLKSTDNYVPLMKAISTDFDEKSRTILSSNPQAIRTLSEHMSSGLYNDISDRVTQLKMLGKVPSDLPDIEVYGRIYKAYSEAMQKPDNIQQPSPENMRVSDQESKRQKRKAVASPKRAKAAVTTTLSEEDILNMPDEAFENITATSLFRHV